MRILIVEDEVKVAEDVCQSLKSAGYIPDIALDGEEGWFLGDTEDYSAIILDLGLPVIDGLTILKKWRAAGKTVPVLILTARGNWTERVTGIDAGADDYLAKPFQVEELLARLRAILRRSAGHAASEIVVGVTTLDTRQMRIIVDGRPLNLTPLEYRAAAYLMLHNDRVVPQHELSDHVYGVDELRDHNTLEVLIGRMRKKLPKDFIKTRRGFGYVISDCDGVAT
ncbi:MAG: response regulator [Methyloligellaceae bacterium]